MTYRFPTGLIIGPGGIKGFVELGALLFLEKVNILCNVKTVVGVSVGSIIGFLLLIGYHVEQIIEEGLAVNLFENLFSGTTFSLLAIKEILNKRGFIDPQSIKVILDRLVIEKFGLVPTLGQLYLMTGINFVSVALNLTTSQVEYFDYIKYPDLICTFPILLSCNIPGVFQPLYYNNCRYVDGAFGNPYPINYFKHPEDSLLGIYIDLSPFISIRDNSNQSNEQFGNPLVELYKSVNTTMFLMRELIILNCHSRFVDQKHLLLTCFQLDPLGLTTSENDKRKMIETGWKQAESFYYSLYSGHPPYIVIRHTEKIQIDPILESELKTNVESKKLSLQHVISRELFQLFSVMVSS